MAQRGCGPGWPGGCGGQARRQLVSPGGYVLHRVDAEVDIAVQEAHIELLGEETLSTQILQRLVEDHVTSGLDDLDLDRVVRHQLREGSSQPPLGLISLRQSQRRAACPQLENRFAHSNADGALPLLHPSSARLADERGARRARQQHAESRSRHIAANDLSIPGGGNNLNLRLTIYKIPAIIDAAPMQQVYLRTVTYRERVCGVADGIMHTPKYTALRHTPAAPNAHALAPPVTFYEM